MTFYGEVCSRGNLPTSRRQLFVQHHVVASDYVVTDDNGCVVTNLDVRLHHLSSEYFAQYFRPTEPPPTYKYEATLLTTTRSPAVAMYVEIDSGSYRLASFSGRRDEGGMHLHQTRRAEVQCQPVCICIFVCICFVCSVSRTLVRLATCCLYVFIVRYFSHLHVASHVIFIATFVYIYMY